nr:hypothetical protein [Tanacetum cinerariifolium]
MLSTTQMRTMFISGLEHVIGRRIIRSLRSLKPDLIGIQMVSTNPNGAQVLHQPIKDHLDAKERKQDKCPLEIPLNFEEDVFDDEVQRNEAIPLSDEEIALDANASSEGTLSPGGPWYDYMMSSEAEDDY